MLCACNKDISPNLNVIHPCVIYHASLCFVIDQKVEHGIFLIDTPP